MKKFIMLLVVGVLSFATQAQEKTAKIEFKQLVIDYGEIAKGSDGVLVFEFTNAGDAPLVISDVRSGCGCTIPKKPEAPIAPGATGKSEVKYDTNRVGPIRKTVTVQSNADTPTVAVKIKGKVLASAPQ